MIDGEGAVTSYDTATKKHAATSFLNGAGWASAAILPAQFRNPPARLISEDCPAFLDSAGKAPLL